MEIRKDKKIEITGTHVCRVVGCLSLGCAIYWGWQALFNQNVNLPMLAISIATSLVGFRYGRTNTKSNEAVFSKRAGENVKSKQKKFGKM